jgi:hypothetical protein
MMNEKTDLTCDFCPEPVSKTDFETGRAVTLMGKHYCNRCMIEAIERSRDENVLPQFLTPWPGTITRPPPKDQRAP